MKFFYVRVRIYPDRTGRYIDLPGISRNGQVVEILLDYFESKLEAKVAIPTIEKIREAVRLFLDYTVANMPDSTFGEPVKTDLKPYQHFTRFAAALRSGTFGVESGRDPSNLGWVPRPAHKVKRVIYHLTEFLDWVEMRNQGTNITRWNPEAADSGFERMVQRAAYEFKRSRNFLGHLAKTADESGSRETSVSRTPAARTGRPAEFPSDKLRILLSEGFRVAGRHNIRDILITLLLDGAGFRESEPFHLYVQDVCMDPANPGVALVRVFHPSEGEAPRDPALGDRKMRRKEYLQTRYGLTPRTLHLSSRVGEKGGRYDDPQLFKQAHWFPEEYGREFWRLWKIYLKQIASIPRDHPYAFICFNRANLGKPYTIGSYEEAYERAVYRCGLVPKGTSGLKKLGLTRHGHRHAYAQRHKRCDTPKLFLQIFLKHLSPDSQEAYTQMSSEEITAELRRAQAKLVERGEALPLDLDVSA